MDVITIFDNTPDCLYEVAEEIPLTTEGLAEAKEVVRANEKGARQSHKYSKNAIDNSPAQLY